MVIFWCNWITFESSITFLFNFSLINHIQKENNNVTNFNQGSENGTTAIYEILYGIYAEL